MTRVLIVASSAVVRAGLESVLSTASDLEVVATISPGAPLDRQPQADVLLVDLEQEGSLPRLQALDAGSTAVVILGGMSVTEALRGGARAILPREAEGEEIVAAVRAAAAGLVVLPPESVGSLLPHLVPQRASDAVEEALTPREIEVLTMLAEGTGNKLIARRLGISEHTVKFHVGSILAKLGAGSRTEAVTVGIRQGLILV